MQSPSALQEELGHHCRNIRISTQTAAEQVLKLLSEPLPPMCITRDLDLQQGVSIPLERFVNKVLPLWFDASLGYVSITKRHTSDWKLWWKNPTKVELHQFMGMDYVPFHAVHLPSILIGTQETWSLPSSINATQSLFFETDTSKSKDGVICGNIVRSMGLPAELWRYYLISIRSEDSDMIFSWDDFGDKLNNNLVDDMSKLIYSVLAFVAKPPGKGYGSIIPDVSGVVAEDFDVNLGANISVFVQEYIEAMEKASLKKGLEAVMKIAQVGNQYFHESNVWKLYKEDKLRCSFVVKSLVGAIYILACLLEPFIPSLTAEVLRQLDLPVAEILLDDDIDKTRKPWDIIPSGHKIGMPRRLFKKMETKYVEIFKRSFSKRLGNKFEDVIVSALPKKRNIERSVEASLKRCSTFKKLETEKEDATSSQLPKGMKDGAFTTTNRNLIPARRELNTYTERLKEKCRERCRRTTRILSPQAEVLFKKGMSVLGIMRKLGSQSAFTNWVDGSSIRVTLNRTGKRVLGISRPGNCFHNKWS